MSGDEQRVRTMAGWIGVEISRSRVRTPGKAGYGLYRVRGSVARSCGCDRGRGEHVWSLGEWTPYAFSLDVIEAQVNNAIGMGVPEKPADLHLPRSRVELGELPYATVPTRWTQAYRGRRDLGVSLGERPHDAEHCDEGGRPHLGPCVEPGFAVTLKPEAVQRISAVAALVDEGLIEMRHTQWCVCEGTHRLTMACVLATMGDEQAGPVVQARQAEVASTVRSRQREANAEFQAEHLAARAFGLVRRHAAKAEHNGRKLAAERSAEGLSGSPEGGSEGQGSSGGAQTLSDGY